MTDGRDEKRVMSNLRNVVDNESLVTRYSLLQTEATHE